MTVGRHPEVVGAPDVQADLEGVVAQQLRDVAHRLPLFFILSEGTVASAGVVVEAPSKVHIGLVAPDREVRQTAGERIVGVVQIRDPGVQGRVRSVEAREHVDLVLKPPEPEVDEHRGRGRVIDPV